MGLDNGILLKVKNQEKMGKMPSWLKPDVSYSDRGVCDTFELMYWRKCYNIRDVIFQHLHENNIKTVDDCSEDMNMSLDVFWELCNKLERCYTPKWWKEHDETIWSYNDIAKTYKTALAEARRVVGWLEDKDPDAYEIIFYDSY